MLTNNSCYGMNLSRKEKPTYKIDLFKLISNIVITGKFAIICN